MNIKKILFFSASWLIVEGLSSYVTFASDNDKEELSSERVSFVRHLERVPLLPSDVGKKKKFSDKDFDDTFPVCKGNAKISVGLIVDSGTGTIIENKGETVVGITAKHVFFDDKGKMLPKFGNFHQASMEKDGKIIVGAVIKIDEIRLYEDLNNKIDIALFIGRYRIKNPEVPGIDVAHSNISKTALGKKRDIIVYHYPWGVEDQRFKKGKVESIEGKGEGRHLISTLRGSSGAPIFNERDEIIGIHSGWNEIEKQGTIKYTGNKFKSLMSMCPDMIDVPIAGSSRYAPILYGEVSKFSRRFGEIDSIHKSVSNESSKKRKGESSPVQKKGEKVKKGRKDSSKSKK